MSSVKPIPDGFTALTPHIIVKGADNAIAFYKKAFGAEEVMIMPGPGGKGVMHAELSVGGARFMMCDEFPGCDDSAKSPATVGGTTVALHLYVRDVDASFKRAVDAGAKATMPPMDMFWGDRFSQVLDPFGHRWSIATHTKDVTPEECAKGAQEFFCAQK